MAFSISFHPFFQSVQLVIPDLAAEILSVLVVRASVCLPILGSLSRHCIGKVATPSRLGQPNTMTTIDNIEFDPSTSIS